MSKLKIKLYNEGNLVIFRVLEQCDSITVEDGDLSMTFDSSNGMKIATCLSPAISPNSICLRGSDVENNSRAESHRCDTEEQATALVAKALDALKEFKENNYFEGIKPATIEDNTYVFSSNGKTMLKVKLYNEGSAVILRVLEQCESLRYRSASLEFRASNGLHIASSLRPNLTISVLWLRGHDVSADNHTCMCQFKTESEAEAYVRIALKALKEFADNNYFGGKEAVESAIPTDHIYEF